MFGTRMTIPARMILGVLVVLAAALIASHATADNSQFDGLAASGIGEMRVIVEGPLGDSDLLLTSFTGEETLSGLFEFELDLLSDGAAVQAVDVVGKRASWSVALSDGTRRNFDGRISRYSRGTAPTGSTTVPLVIEVVPWMWFLSRTSDSRIFSSMTVPEVIAQVFDDLGFAEYESALTSAYEPRDYVVQYRETDFNFVSRLMEQEGIFYYFRHEDGDHTLVLADYTDAYCDLPESEVEYTGGIVGSRPGITAWEHRYEFRSGRWTLRDYDFENPSKDLEVSVSGTVDIPEALRLELFDFPGGYIETLDGARLARLRMEEEESTFDTVEGAGDVRSFSPCGKFTLTGHPHPSDNAEYVLTAVSHSAVDMFSYENTFTAIPADAPYRPPRITPNPVVSGPQTAFVTGPVGEEIFTDSFGRVKVRFHWDRENTTGDKDCCWIRLAHDYAGKGWGRLVIPRIGQEVLVEFLEGDPDRPIITGRVYNADSMPPYPLSPGGAHK